ncbi:Hypothetical protein NTJ_10045 [Nesidiocoris tenuis]|uniref:Uncharacterized protein n=1 Tax=Nesidiocoris tenuis TaxID=355587 RepID=A0ABN7B239_9HEMI|nr:Hypothetical protein NTJ_10045 [Nesidiocoris tenuis]
MSRMLVACLTGSSLPLCDGQDVSICVGDFVFLRPTVHTGTVIVLRDVGFCCRSRKRKNRRSNIKEEEYAPQSKPFKLHLEISKDITNLRYSVDLWSKTSVTKKYKQPCSATIAEI